MVLLSQICSDSHETVRGCHVTVGCHFSCNVQVRIRIHIPVLHVSSSLQLHTGIPSPSGHYDQTEHSAAQWKLHNRQGPHGAHSRGLDASASYPPAQRAATGEKGPDRDEENEHTAHKAMVMGIRQALRAHLSSDQSPARLVHQPYQPSPAAYRGEHEERGRSAMVGVFCSCD